MKTTVHLVVAGALLSATCFQISTFASGEGNETISSTLEARPDVEFIRAAIDSQDSQIVTLLVETTVHLTVGSFEAELDSRTPTGQYRHAREGDKRYWRVKYLNEARTRVIQDTEISFDGTTSKSAGHAGRPPTGRIHLGPPPSAYRTVFPVPTRIRVWDKELLTRLHDDQLELLPSRESVSGASCYVLVGRAAEGPEALKYKVWVDPEMGFMPRQVDEIRTVHPKELTNRKRLMSYEEIKPGIWFPRKVEEEGHQGGAIFTHNIYVVSSLEVNERLPSGVFDVDFDPGAQVQDEVLGTSYFVPEQRGTNGKEHAGAAGHAITLDQIRQVYEHKFDFLQSYRVKYTEDTTRWSDKEKQTVVAAYTVAYEHYVKGDKFGIKRLEIDLSSDEVSSTVSDWKAYNGKYLRSASYYNGAIVSGRVETLTDRSRYNMGVYHPMALVGLHSAVIGDERIRPIGNSFSTDIRSLTLYRTSRVLPETEVVNGHKCCIVDAPPAPTSKSYFRVWLALDLDLALVKRELRVYAPSGVETMLYSIECDEFRELEPGLFLPQKIAVEGFSASEREFREASTTEYIITSVELKPDIPDDAFEIEFPEGMRVKDETMNAGVAQRQSPPRERLVGKQAPELDVAEWVSGEPTSLASLRGKTVVLAFWDRRDKACGELVSVLNALFGKYREKDVEIISIHSADADLDALKQFISDNAIKFRVPVDKPTDDYAGATFEEYRVKIPLALFIIDAEGKVRYQDIPLAAVEEAVKHLLDEQ
jgi:peroxiredoxin